MAHRNKSDGLSYKAINVKGAQTARSDGTALPLPVRDSHRGRALDEWLQWNNAYMVWRQKGIDGTPEVSSYNICGRSVLVVEHWTPTYGWELYLPASDSIKTVDTLDAAAARIGNGCIGSTQLGRGKPK